MVQKSIFIQHTSGLDAVCGHLVCCMAAMSSITFHSVCCLVCYLNHEVRILLGPMSDLLVNTLSCSVWCKHL